MSLKRYSPTLKTRNDLVGEITPMVFLETPVDRPTCGHGSFLPAPWLPIQWQDEVSKDYFVMSSGKIVCFTDEGHLAPAGLKLAWAASTGLTYTSDDYANKTQDITTGEEYAVNGTTTYTPTNIRDGLRSRGLIGSSEAAADFLSLPVGAILYDVYAWAGGNGWNPALYKFQNYIKQQGIQYTTASQMQLPVVPAEHVSVNVPGSLTGSALTFGSGNLYSSTNTLSKERYDSATNTDFIAWAIADYPIATDTDRTPVEGSSTDFLVREIKVNYPQYATAEEAICAAIDRLTTAGDYFIDYNAGVVFMYASGGASIPSNVSGESITFYSYTAAPATVERYACIVGDPRPGDWLKVDSNSNLQVWTTSDAAWIRIARVHKLEQEPKDLLDRVQTAWTGTGMSTKQQMTGTATKGFSSVITYSGASDKLARLVLSVR